MLDFYIIKDATPISTHEASGLDYVGGIDYSDFEYLQNQNIIESWLDYYQDFRWTNEHVVKKLDHLSNYILSLNHPSELKILNFLKIAQEAGTGLIAYCD